MDTEGDFRTALTAKDPYRELRAAAIQAVAEGRVRQDLVDMLEAMRPELQEQGLEDVENAVLDVMDELAGWTSASLWI